ncbi:lipid phosphate phosphatase epsilon 2, chloroplastic-like [Impatiens glandulifera]|uniref:lipid phosphate phosphatase epsilon 2, chloroplastic-like n=1 Tax=Impatiens glandulifera TaxID=253017 RepID=UPI001FB167BA|nr:lipid phosphate phosphatase epsilon 2, chloroplastic-like [Impatiens glandulifera]
MALVKFLNISGFINFDNIRFHNTHSVSKSFPPSSELSFRRMKFLCRGRGNFFGKTHISLDRSDQSNECIHSLGQGQEQEQEEEARSSSSRRIDKRLKLCINGLESTLNSQSKWLMAIFFVGFILWRRDGPASWAAIGSLVNFGLSKILKKMLNQERPVSHFNRSDPGMPSSHSQSIFYTSILAIISMVQYHGFNGFTMLLCPLIFSLASYLSWLRVSHQLHTTNQVKVGAVIGTAFSIFWLWSWDVFVLNAFITYSWVRNVVTLMAVGYCLGLFVSFSKNIFNRIHKA